METAEIGKHLFPRLHTTPPSVNSFICLYLFNEWSDSKICIDNQNKIPFTVLKTIEKMWAPDKKCSVFVVEVSLRSI